MRILLGIIIGIFSEGLLLALAAYIVTINVPFNGGGSFMSVSEPEKLAAVGGGIYGVLLGAVSGAIISGMGLNVGKSILVSVILYFICGILFIFWIGSDPFYEVTIGWLFAAILVSGIVSGFFVSLIVNLTFGQAE